MKSAVKAAVVLAILFAIPILPFIWLGESFESRLLNVLREPSSPQIVATSVIGLLASDMFLPVPSSAVITYAGGVLGIVSGTMVSWIGLSVGAIGGFGLSRIFGEAIARRFSDAEDVARMSSFTQRHGTAAIVTTRAFPILAEVCVLMLGAARLSWRAFLPPMLLSNALLALTYSACGAYFQGTDAFLIAIIASGAVPLFIALLVRRCWRPNQPNDSAQKSNAP